MILSSFNCEMKAVLFNPDYAHSYWLITIAVELPVNDVNQALAKLTTDCFALCQAYYNFAGLAQ